LNTKLFMVDTYDLHILIPKSAFKKLPPPPPTSGMAARIYCLQTNRVIKLYGYLFKLSFDIVVCAMHIVQCLHNLLKKPAS